MPRASSITPALPSPIRLPARRDPAVRAVASAWRRLTGGTAHGADLQRRTLIACSGGGDSSGLTLALAAIPSDPRSTFVVAHILHDLRPPDQARADRDAAAALASALGLEFAEAPIAVRAAGGNPESQARRLRYAALARLSQEHGCPFIATAHHADDQLETMLMALLRGAGPRGLAGAAPRRKVNGSDIRIIRPALDLRRADLQRLCTESGWSWREDTTNTDATRLRAAVRHRIAPALESLRPGAARRAARAASLLSDAAAVIQAQAREIIDRHARHDSDHFAFPRGELRRRRAIVLGELLRLASARLAGGRRLDRLTSTAVDPVTDAIRGASTQPRRFTIGGIRVEVNAHDVTIHEATNNRPKNADSPKGHE